MATIYRAWGHCQAAYATLLTVMTWFDALLITVWALIAALGFRRGLGGLIWGLGSAAVAYGLGKVGLGWLPSSVIATLVAAALGFGVQNWLEFADEYIWQRVLGGVGGVLLGGLLVSAIALGMPLRYQGSKLIYPSDKLPMLLQQGVKESYVRTKLMPLWHANSPLKTVFAPDQVKKK